MKTHETWLSKCKEFLLVKHQRATYGSQTCHKKPVTCDSKLKKGYIFKNSTLTKKLIRNHKKTQQLLKK